jgi:hypothetical protein
MTSIVEFRQMPEIQGPFAFRYAEIMAAFPEYDPGYFIPVGEAEDVDFEPKPNVIERWSTNRSTSARRITAVNKFQATLSMKVMQWGLFLKAASTLGDQVPYTQTVLGAGTEGVLTTKAHVGRYMVNGFNISNVAIATTGGGPISYVEGTDFFLDDPKGGFITVESLPDGVEDGDAIQIKFRRPAILDTAKLYKNPLLVKPFQKCSLLIRQLAAQGPQEMLYLPEVNMTPKSGIKWVAGDEFQGVELNGDVLDNGGGFGYRVDIPA